MRENIEEIARATMQLSIEDRALLVGQLLLSLDEPASSELERMWLVEAESRLDDYRAGRVQGIAGDEVFRRAVAELS